MIILTENEAAHVKRLMNRGASRTEAYKVVEMRRKDPSFIYCRLCGEIAKGVSSKARLCLSCLHRRKKIRDRQRKTMKYYFDVKANPLRYEPFVWCDFADDIIDIADCLCSKPCRPAKIIKRYNQSVEKRRAQIED